MHRICNSPWHVLSRPPCVPAPPGGSSPVPEPPAAHPRTRSTCTALRSPACPAPAVPGCPSPSSTFFAARSSPGTPAAGPCPAPPTHHRPCAPPVPPPPAGHGAVQTPPAVLALHRPATPASLPRGSRLPAGRPPPCNPAGCSSHPAQRPRRRPAPTPSQRQTSSFGFSLFALRFVSTEPGRQTLQNPTPPLARVTRA